MKIKLTIIKSNVEKIEYSCNVKENDFKNKEKRPHNLRYA